MAHQKIVSRQDWLAAHAAHLVHEKQVTRQRDALAAARRELPWTRVENDYVFHDAKGPVRLADLFDGRSQLIIKHFMFGPDWNEGCVGCSFEMDHIQGALLHVPHHDVSFAAVSRAPFAKLDAFRQRMGWQFRWLSSAGSDFNRDFMVSFEPQDIVDGKVFHNYSWRPFECEELSGFSVFYREEDGRIFQTFSAFGRGAEELLGSYVLLDMTPNGRNENGPRRNLTDWVRHHDRYGSGNGAASNGCAVPAERGSSTDRCH
ncbi:thioredoxin family protein [Pseudomonas knackmussii]|uniref:Thioredoxin family protein n=1 Tax=Pseudomonas knackmussii TaxID=65741 RepID=A0ABY4KVU3_9PSED|nr:thioredoxin family protein [Pseudomonas knackmussii]UPQ83485.1 thioredoxin family protein [Pseudomonas knackmussii]